MNPHVPTWRSTKQVLFTVADDQTCAVANCASAVIDKLISSSFQTFSSYFKHPIVPDMKVDEVLACSFPHWYPEFSKITIRSEVIPVPDEVLAYLRSNSSVVLPKVIFDTHSCYVQANHFSQECENNCKPSNRKTDDDDNEDMERSAFEDDDENGDEGEVPHFPEFSKTIGKAIDRLGGSVFCKLNWSAPRYDVK